MPFGLPSFDISIIGWIFIGLAGVVLLVALLRLFGHLFQIAIRGCGLVLLAVVVFYALRLFGVI